MDGEYKALWGSNKSGAPIMDWETHDPAQIDPIMLQIIKKLEEDMIHLKNIMRNQNQEMINLKTTIMN